MQDDILVSLSGIQALVRFDDGYPFSCFCSNVDGGFAVWTAFDLYGHAGL